MSGSEKQRLEIDRRILFTALGFVAIASKGGRAADQSEQVLAMADLIETFCRLRVPEAFDDDAAPVDNSKRDSMVAAIADIMRADGRCSPCRAAIKVRTQRQSG